MKPFSCRAVGTAALIAVLALPGCNAGSRFEEIGSAPKLAQIAPPPAQAQTVSLPMPTPMPDNRQPNSLWRAGSRAFFRDQRASRVGDILTININLDEKAKMSNKTKRGRDNSDSAGMPSLWGFESKLAKYFPDAVDPEKLVDLSSKTSNSGSGEIDRGETIQLRVAAMITQVLPNGNLVLQGKQQIVVNYEMRELTVAGVVRPEDISSANSVNYDQIAEARVSYGGRGQIIDVQQPRYGQQVLDVIMPF
ncbi:MAG: flagellar basal body L-ring protein FlgH [Alphaproteobacteria bacterium]|nr:MAG: flagellar basal body L-ring protein FlgH [Alphaproteobacteria bacterium]